MDQPLFVNYDSTVVVLPIIGVEADIVGILNDLA